MKSEKEKSYKQQRPTNWSKKVYIHMQSSTR